MGIKKLWKCKVKKQHFFIQDKHELNGKSSIKIYYKCKLCGKEVYQIINVGFDNVKNKGE